MYIYESLWECEVEILILTEWNTVKDIKPVLKFPI